MVHSVKKLTPITLEALAKAANGIDRFWEECLLARPLSPSRDSRGGTPHRRPVGDSE